MPPSPLSSVAHLPVPLVHHASPLVQASPPKRLRVDGDDHASGDTSNDHAPVDSRSGGNEGRESEFGSEDESGTEEDLEEWAKEFEEGLKGS